MRFHLICRVRSTVQTIDCTPTVQADERIEADTAAEALIQWLQSGDSWIHADGADQLKLRQIIDYKKKGFHIDDEFMTETTGTDWSFPIDGLDFDDTELSFGGSSCHGEFEFEVEIKQYVDGSELDNGLFVVDPASLKFDDLVQIVRFCQGGLFMDTDENDRDTWTLDKDVSGSVFIDHISGILDKHGLVPKEVK